MAGGTPAEPVPTELLFIGAPGATTAEEIGALAVAAWTEANDPDGPPHIVSDLRAFQVDFI